MKAKPVFEDSNNQIFQRPNLSYINFELLIKEKKNYDIGVWSSQNRETTELLVKYLFGRFYSQ